MEKRRVTCPRCGTALAQPATGRPATGRPRVYCGPLCRRDAEYRLRRVQSHLARAERSLTTARLQAATADSYDGYREPRAEAGKRVKFWAAEVKSLSAELRAALVDLAEDQVDVEEPPPRLRAAG